jgi:hypothetical protein
MAKDSNQPLVTPKTPFENALHDASSLAARVDSYKESLKPLNLKPAEGKVQHFNGTLSVVEGLGADVIRNNVPETEVNKLVGSIYKNMEAASKLTNEPTETSKLQLNAAKTEAALKGFVLPLSMGGPSDALKNFGLKQSEYEIPMNATKQALLEMSNKDIPKAEFAQKVSEKTQEILKGQGHDQDKLNQFKQFVEQGEQKNKPSKFTAQEQKKIAEAATNSVTKLGESINKDIKEINTISSKSSLSKQASGVLKGVKKQLKPITNRLSQAVKSDTSKKLPAQKGAISAEVIKEAKVIGRNTFLPTTATKIVDASKTAQLQPPIKNKKPEANRGR